jgi:hypothetical protein
MTRISPALEKRGELAGQLMIANPDCLAGPDEVFGEKNVLVGQYLAADIFEETLRIFLRSIG